MVQCPRRQTRWRRDCTSGAEENSATGNLLLGRGIHKLRRWGGRWFVFFGVHESEFFQLVAQRIAADVEQPCGVGLVAGGLRHGQLDERALDFLQRSAAFGYEEFGQASAVGQLRRTAAVASAGRYLEGGISCLLLCDGERQIVWPEYVALFQDHGALDRVLEFAHVSRPIVPEQQLAGVVSYALHRLAELAVVTIDEVLDQRQDIFFAVA